VINWGIVNGYTSLRSSGLNYDPKLHMCAPVRKPASGAAARCCCVAK
jgi:hypothetical protein